MLSPDQIAQKWANNLGASTENIRQSVQSVSVAPGQAAARQKTAYVNGVNQSQDKWARNVAAVSLGEWQQAMINKGLPRIAGGAQEAMPEFQQFMTRLLPYIQNGLSTLPPRGSLDQNIARAAAMMRYMANFQG